MVPILLLLLLMLEFSPSTAQQQPISNISLGSSISATSNSYWSSNSGHFAFGFYPKGAGFAIGIWFARARPVTVVWTASRDLPPLPNDSSLVLSRDGRLILSGRQFLELPEPASSASILDSGNFVVYGSNSEIIWQSFDSPTDTLLPGQPLSAGQQLISSLSETDHSTGRFKLVMQHDGNLVQYPTDIPSGPKSSYWDSSTYEAGDNVTLNLDDDGHLYLLNSTGFNIKSLSLGRGSISNRRLYRMTIDAGGLLRLYSHGLEQNGDWAIEWSSSNNNCDPTGLCGPNAYCTLMNGQETACECLTGFDFIHPGQSSLGCSRIGSTDGCLGKDESRLDRIDRLKSIVWQGDPYFFLFNVSMAACVDNCSQDCYCDAVVYRDGNCSRQNLPLWFGRAMQSDETTYVRVGTGSSSKTGDKGGERDNKVATSIFIAGIVFLTIAFIVLAIAGVVTYKYGGKGYKRVSDKGTDGLIEDVTVRAFTYGELEKATKGFAEEVGRGAFGTVFKGVIDIANGKRVVAVKRLEIAVAESEREFRNEVNVIGRTHHKNLVRLLGYCHDGTNRLLVYDFMSNGSLSDFLFNSKTKPKWEERVGIALNVAKGILYLHEECETRIIHCDIKPANILMDGNNCAKISDFGLAKLMNPNQTRTHTGIRGTRGYVAPEWHRNLPITVKADVYSFGIVLLEIICCRRSLEMEAAEDEIVLADWVFECFEKGEVGKLVEMEDEEVDMIKLNRMVKVGLWCIQEEPSLRPSIQRVVLMGSTVPGNGLSTRWFLGYTCCDACGRLFVKGNYCPVCLKVYRDSESTPMVCCDVCQRWVHCQCDGISDEKYLQFQVDGNLQYKCATCRGECYEVRNLEDAVQELWRRRDQADRDLIANLREAAGLPTQEEIFSISPYSDDEENDPSILKNEYGHSLKFSLKGFVDKSPKKAKEYGKKPTNKKYTKKKGYEYQPSLISKIEVHQNFDGHSDAQSFKYSVGNDKNDDVQSNKSAELLSSPAGRSLTEEISSINQAGVQKHKFINDVAVINDNMKSRMGQIKGDQPHDLDSVDNMEKNNSKSKTTKGPKLVIHLGGRTRNANSSPGSDASSYQREQDYGSEDMGHQQTSGRHLLGRHDATTKNGDGAKVNYSHQFRRTNFSGREGNLIKIRKFNNEISDMEPRVGEGNVVNGYAPVSLANPHGSLKKNTEATSAVVSGNEVPATRVNKDCLRKYVEGVSGDCISNNSLTSSVPHSLPKDSKPLLKLKFKNPYNENQTSWVPHSEDERSSVKGQRSKRKRPLPLIEKTLTREDEDVSQWYEDGSVNEIMDANWILQKLGRDAIGKRVDVHQPSDNSWHRGTVTDITENASVVSVSLDDGRARNMELGKQGIRFVSQKQRR